MFRSPVQIRDARPDDAAALLELWGRGGLVGRAPDRDSSPEEPVLHDVSVRETDTPHAAGAVARIAEDPDQRLLVAEVDDRLAGGVHLSRAPLSPVHVGGAVCVMHLQVAEEFRRHGVGHALMEATVTWAEETGTSHVIAAASVASRDANRFMARLGLGQVAVVRGASVAALRSKLPVEPPAAARVGTRTHRSVGHVLAQRRSMRRAQARPS